MLGDFRTLTLSGIETVEGSALNDTITGNAAANLLFGSSGSDRLNGGAERIHWSAAARPIR
ncbi:MAG: hypothetical protein HZT43_15770 [Exiguobacterium profundum]|nr:MAG: hypothetical protein HZT43_15770 [Exiguobacterium profundum]